MGPIYSKLDWVQCLMMQRDAFYLFKNRAFSYDVTAAILVFQNKETAAILVYQAIPRGIKLYFMQKSSFVLVNQYGR